MTGIELRELRTRLGVSQAKLSKLTKITQSKISAFELEKAPLDPKSIVHIQSVLTNLTPEKIKKIKKRTYKKTEFTDSILTKRPRRSYVKSSRNKEYLDLLKELEDNFKSTPQKPPLAVSFFAGCGGLCYGVQSAGFKIVAVNELVDVYREIHKVNFPDAEYLPNDIRDISDDHLKQLLENYPEISLLVGGPPCQGFSLAGKRDVNDHRNTLFEDYLRIANTIRPKVILMENVKLLTSMKDPNGTLVADRILNKFREYGYNSQFFCINAKEYAVPQDRERVFFIGIRNDLDLAPSIPKPICSEDINLFSENKPYFSLSDAVSDLEFIESGESSDTDKHHKAVNHPEHVIRWLVDVPEGKSAHDNEDEKLRPPSGYNTTYKRQVWSKPSSTVATTFSMISGCRNVHPIATRAMTTREALRLQSFPDSFKLVGKAGNVRTTIGNAVPPLLARALAKHLKETYNL